MFMSDRKKITLPYLFKKVADGSPITWLTCYDFPTAYLQEQAGIEMILVGDSLGMTMLGYDSTLPVTMDDMVRHAQAVRRGAPTAFLVGDMPYMTYQPSVETAIRSAGRFMAECGCDAIKLEGGRPMLETVRFLVERGIPVCGHVGLTPQAVHQLGGFRVQGRTADTARVLLDDAKALQDAGAAMIVLEAIPSALAAQATDALAIPTIGIGAGAACSGQVLVLHDMLDIYPGKKAKFVRNFMAGADGVRSALRRYVEAVKSGEFPGPEHSFQ